MNFICLKEYLQKAVAATERISGKGAALASIQNILVRAEKGRIEFAATDLEQGIRYFIPGKIQKEGVSCIPAHLFAQITQYLPTDKIEFQQKQNAVVVRSGEFSASIQTYPQEEFPIIPSLSGKTYEFTQDTKEFSEGVAHTLPMIGSSEIRQELSGILVRAKEKEVIFAATDTFRLGEVKIPQKENVSENEFILPAKAAEMIPKIFSEEKKLQFFVSRQQLFVKSEDREFVSRLIEGTYPAYESIIPEKKETTILLTKDALLSALQTVSVFSGRLQDVMVSVKPNALELKTKSEGVGESQITIACATSGAYEKPLTFNWRYLIEGIEQFTEQNLEWWLNAETSPALLKLAKEDHEKPSFRYVVMPIRPT